MKKWHIIGNGAGEIIPREGDMVIRLNQYVSESPNTSLTITNSKLAALTKGYLVRGKAPCEDFALKLEASSHQLAKQLGCIPSLGLVVIKTMLDLNAVVQVSGMNLLPPLRRPQNHCIRKALPAAYHNWLGERRLAAHWLNDLNWPLFWLEAPGDNYLEFTPSFSLLIDLPHLPRDEAHHLWKVLSNVNYLSWLKQADLEKLEAVESLFYVSRDTNTTPNWWMFDNQLSVSVSRLQKTLALVQQTIHQSGEVKA